MKNTELKVLELIKNLVQNIEKNNKEIELDIDIVSKLNEVILALNKTDKNRFIVTLIIFLIELFLKKCTIKQKETSNKKSK